MTLTFNPDYPYLATELAAKRTLCLNVIRLAEEQGKTEYPAYAQAKRVLALVEERRQ